ncbi:MAG: Fe-S cluster assembly protein SufB [Enterobacteriaceae bacterium]
MKNKENNSYRHGFFTKIKSRKLKKGISSKIIKEISKIRKEPDWMLKFRLKAYYAWKKMKEPNWLNATYKSVNYNSYSYYSYPNLNEQNKNKKKSFNKIKNAFNKLGIEIDNKKSKIAIDAIFDSVSISTTKKKFLRKKGIIFCSFNEAVKKYSYIVKKYLGSVVPYNDNFFAALNSAVASDGTFVYVPKGVKCPIEISSYFRINSKNVGQFERTMLIADEESYISYLEGCSSSVGNKFRLHAAVVEIILMKKSKVKYSTVQNWYPGNSKKSGILNFVTKRAICLGKYSKMSWIQSETGSAVTWKYPSVILKGRFSSGSFYSVSLTKDVQQTDTGTKMIHIGKNTNSTIISKSVSFGKSSNTYRSIVKISKKANNCRNYTQCDAILIGNKCSSHTFPIIESNNFTSLVEHEAKSDKISEDQLFYCRQRGISKEDSIFVIINGFCKNIFSKLPFEFSVEVQDILKSNIKKILT